MQSLLDKSEITVNSIELFFPVTFNPSRRADFCVRKEHGKLCFKALETELVPQNNLPCLELKKRLSEVSVFV